MLNSFARLASLPAVASLVVALSASASPAEVPSVLSLAVPPEGSSGYLIATGYTGGILEKTDVAKILLQPFGGSGNWPALMNRGEIDLGQHCGYEQLSQAASGSGPFEQMGPQKDIRVIATGYGLPWGVHAVDDGVTSIADLKGKAVFVQVSHSDHVTAMRELLAKAGLDYDKDITVLPFQSPQEAVQGLLTGRGDAVAFGLIPNLAEVKRARGLHTVSLSPEAIQRVQEADPVWGKVTIPANFGPLAPEAETGLLEIECGLAAGAHLSEETVYEITKALYETQPEWQSVNPLARQWTPEKALALHVVPFHYGAIKYFKEIGIWKE